MPKNPFTSLNEGIKKLFNKAPAQPIPAQGPSITEPELEQAGAMLVLIEGLPDPQVSINQPEPVQSVPQAVTSPETVIKDTPTETMKSSESAERKTEMKFTASDFAVEISKIIVSEESSKEINAGDRWTVEVPEAMELKSITARVDALDRALNAMGFEIKRRRTDPKSGPSFTALFHKATEQMFDIPGHEKTQAKLNCQTLESANYSLDLHLAAMNMAICAIKGEAIRTELHKAKGLFLVYSPTAALSLMRNSALIPCGGSIDGGIRLRMPTPEAQRLARKNNLEFFKPEIQTWVDFNIEHVPEEYRSQLHPLLLALDSKRRRLAGEGYYLQAVKCANDGFSADVLSITEPGEKRNEHRLTYGYSLRTKQGMGTTKDTRAVQILEAANSLYDQAFGSTDVFGYKAPAPKQPYGSFIPDVMDLREAGMDERKAWMEEANKPARRKKPAKAAKNVTAPAAPEPQPPTPTPEQKTILTIPVGPRKHSFLDNL